MKILHFVWKQILVIVQFIFYNWMCFKVIMYNKKIKKKLQKKKKKNLWITEKKNHKS